jgi:DNA-binding beta-propeller fold protein YncE
MVATMAEPTMSSMRPNPTTGKAWLPGTKGSLISFNHDKGVWEDVGDMTVSADGGALYVVNYDAATMSKIRISDFTVVATLPTDGNPIGITYEPTKKAVWVACYGGTILVFDDSRKAA